MGQNEYCCKGKNNLIFILLKNYRKKRKYW